MEKDDEVKGGGNSYTTEFRQYDARLGRWLSLDPLMAKFPWQSPFCAFDNNPVYFVDNDGLSSEPPSTDVKENSDGSYTVVGAYNDNDKNIYVVNENGKRTGQTIGTTMQSTDFMKTNDKTGAFEGHATINFDLDELSVSGDIKVDQHTIWSIDKGEAQDLLNMGMKIYQDQLNKENPFTFYGKLEILRDLSGNDKPLDFKKSLDLNPYTAIKAGKTSDGKPIITTVRAVGNIVFGANLKTSKAPVFSSDYYYKSVMEEVGRYNQNKNKGNGYNNGYPFFGEHTYSGSYIYYGYFNKFYK